MNCRVKIGKNKKKSVITIVCRAQFRIFCASICVLLQTVGFRDFRIFAGKTEHDVVKILLASIFLDWFFSEIFDGRRQIDAG